MKKSWLLLSVLLLLGGCKEERTSPGKTGIELGPQHIRVCESIDLERICDSICYIPLETTDSSLIGHVTAVRLVGDRILIGDENQSLLVFDRKGHFLNTIGKRGRGLGEYIAMDCFFVDAQQQPVIWDPISEKLYFYTLTGRLLKTVDIQKAVSMNLLDGNSLNMRIVQIQPVNDTVIFLAYCISRFSDVVYALYNLDTGMLHRVGRLGHVLNMDAYFLRLSSHPSHRYKDRISCIMPYSSVIYQLSDTSLQPLYVVHPIPARKLPDGYLDHNKNKTEEQLWEDCENYEYVKPLSVYESENNLIVQCNDLNRRCYLFWNKNSRQGFYAPFKSKNPRIVQDLENDICVEHWGVARLLEECAYKIKMGQPINERIGQLSRQLNEEDNPVIILNYLKKNWESEQK